MADWRAGFPDLPILDDLGQQVHRAAVEDEVAQRQTARRPSRRGRLAGRGRLRWVRARPALATAVLLVLALPAALLASKLVSTDEPDRRAARESSQAGSGAAVDSAASLLASGSGPEEAWRLTSVETAQGGCVTLKVADGPPGPSVCLGGDASAERAQRAAGALDVAATNGRRDGFVFGTVAPGAATVRITVGDRPPATVPTRRVAGRSGGAGIEGRAFVATFDRTLSRDIAVRLVAFDEDGRTIARLSETVHRR